MTRSRCGRKWESIVQICGIRVYLGLFDYRSEAAKAEATAIKIRDALVRNAVIEKKRGNEIVNQPC